MSSHSFRLVATAIVASVSVAAWAHPGGLDANGCHTNKKTGEYHCHRSATAEKEKGIVKKSGSGICHGPSSPYYAQTKNFTAFSSIEDCLNSGGRLPK